MQQTETLLPTGIEEIKTKIHEIRGQKVMIDADLAQLYQVETRVLNQAVKRNIKRFPPDFMFQLNEEEARNLKSQFVTSSWGGIRKLPFAFTEQGLAMLSGLLNSGIAIQVNINIMRAFVFLRHTTIPIPNDTKIQLDGLKSELQSLTTYIDEVLHDQNDINEDTATQLELINQTLAELQTDRTIRKSFENRKPIGFKIEQK